MLTVRIMTDPRPSRLSLDYDDDFDVAAGDVAAGVDEPEEGILARLLSPVLARGVMTKSQAALQGRVTEDASRPNLPGTVAPVTLMIDRRPAGLVGRQPGWIGWPATWWIGWPCGCCRLTQPDEAYCLTQSDGDYPG